MTVGHEIMYPTVPKQARQSDAVLFNHLGGLTLDWPARESAGGLQVHWLRCIQGTAGLTSCRQSADNDNAATLALPGISTMARSFPLALAAIFYITEEKHVCNGSPLKGFGNVWFNLTGSPLV